MNETRSPYFSITGYWKDDKTEFEGYIICEYDSFIKDWGFEEEDIFFYGLNPSSYTDKELALNQEFVITSYNRIGVKAINKLLN